MSNSDPKEKNQDTFSRMYDLMDPKHQSDFKFKEIRLKNWNKEQPNIIFNEEYVEAVYRARRKAINHQGYLDNFNNLDDLIHEFESQDSNEMSFFDHLTKKLIEPFNPTFQIILKPIMLLFSMKIGTTLISPPKTGEKILYLFLSKDARKHIPGDLEEEFTTIILPKFGPRYARIWYWKQVFFSLVPIIQGRMVKWGTIAWAAKAAEWVSSRFSS